MRKSRTQFATVGPRQPMPRLAFSIPEFCEAHDISASFYYKLTNQNKGPREMEAGARRMITHEAAAEWRRELENQHGRDPPELPEHSE